MPIFDFQCDMCDAVYEEMVPSSDYRPPCKACPDGIMRPKISAPKGFKFKGYGWYKDGYSNTPPGAKRGAGDT